ncbi:hypothetical protein FDJ44_gp52 [Microbacterium phage Pikmin]|uniref:Uncharacterized protein n=2 Tax=Pikminvirus pikmin TaxID=2560596 RepID=A0A2P1CKP0_9CAUD|nr:hypothetical protein FDJ44_gp52 [Microbacterium phage Pikmin]AVJ51190.1 hypothetical protein PBI_PIKMIN_52 [Microbacterium phage Pikmin]AVJ51748.1 hypothetical protein PBI_CASEY_52 [Microbacterium phage Casey]
MSASAPLFVLARAKGGRPTLQHVLASDSFDVTECGLVTRFWSMAYSHAPIPEIICKKCEKKI